MKKYILLITLLYNISALASLGQVKPIQKITSPYRVETSLDGNVTIKEYIDQAGNVFAISWAGTHPPDLNKLLGSFKEEAQKEMKNQNNIITRRSRYNRLETTNLIMERFGSMRNIRGKVILKKYLPPGVNQNEID